MKEQGAKTVNIPAKNERKIRDIRLIVLIKGWKKV